MTLRILTFAFVTAALPGLAAAQPADARTLRTWKAKCASCHGEDGKGNTEAAKKLGGLRDLSQADVQARFDDAKLKDIISKGVKETKDGKQVEMPAYPDLTGAVLDNLVRFVRGLKK